MSWFEAQEEKIGVSEPWVARTNERTLAAIHARVEEAAFAEAWARGRALTVEEAAALARTELARVDG